MPGAAVGHPATFPASGSVVCDVALCPAESAGETGRLPLLRTGEAAVSGAWLVGAGAAPVFAAARRLAAEGGSIARVLGDPPLRSSAVEAADSVWRGDVADDGGETVAPVMEAAAAISTRDRAAADECSADSTTGHVGELPCGVELRRHCADPPVKASLVALRDMSGDMGGGCWLLRVGREEGLSDCMSFEALSCGR